jgi:PAS domain S-box-containing protein
MNGTTDAIFVKDLEHRYIYINPAGARFLGKSPKEVIGKTDAEVFADESARILDSVDRSVITSGKTSYLEETLTAAGATRTYLVTKAPYFTEDRSIIGLIGISHDITERKHVEDELNIRSRVLESMAEAVNLATEDGRILFTNRAHDRMFGYFPGELVGQHVSILNNLPADESNALVMEIISVLKSAGEWRGEIHNRRKDGTPLITRAVISKVEISQQICWISVQEDITERKRIEWTLEQRSLALITSNSELEQFAYVASHDLREPLRVIAAYLGLLSRRYKDSLDAKAREFIGFAVDAAERMDKLIVDLLEFSRAGRQLVQIEEVDSNAVMKRVELNLAEAIQESGARITHGALPVITANSGILERVLQNLIENSIKFRARGRRPEIAVSATWRDAGWVFSVSDNGIGIEQRDQDRVFRIFQRLHPRNEYPGSGIGLAVSKRLVERLGGRIWLNSTPEKGSQFFFTIPKQEAEDPALIGTHAPLARETKYG